MLTHAYVNLNYFFYPIGNTPAINLFRDIQITDRDVDLLLLGCGDVRNILFSLWLEQAQDNGVKLNFSLCDTEPAVLARNVFLFTFLAEKLKSTDVGENDILTPLWNCYYHFFITSGDLKLLQDHARHLCEVSETIDIWIASPYADFVRFANHHTLSEIRRFWTLYTEQHTVDRDKRVRNTIEKIYDTRYSGKHSSVYNGIRSIGVHAASSAATMSVAFKKFWETGVVAGNKHDVNLLQGEHGGRVNPLMAVSSAPLGEFAVHYGCDPLLGYCLVEVFDRDDNQSDTLQSLARTAKSQFFQWCHAFMQYLSTNTVQVVVHCGDAVNFSYRLQNLQGLPTLNEETHIYNRPWRAASVPLERTKKCDLRSTFDIIDTSNIIDHVGILTLLPAVVPLLAQTPSSVLYVESLLRMAEDLSTSLQRLLHSDVATSSLFFGITPIGYLLGNTTESFAPDLFMNVLLNSNGDKSKQFRMRIPWHRSTGGDIYAQSEHPIRVDSEEMANYLTNLYLDMFRESEDLSRRMEVVMATLSNYQASDASFYNRLTLVALIAFIKNRIITNWEHCITSVVNRIECDRSLILGSNNLQELYLHLHSSGLWDVPMLRLNPRSSITEFGMARPSASENGFLGRENIPAIVHIALVVPRQKLRIFTDAALDKIGTPGLHLSVSNTHLFENCFFAIDTFFGKLRSASGAEGQCIVEEDPKGWKGESSLIATCAVPTWPLLVGPRQGLRVALAVNTTIQSTILLTRQLGSRMRVFDAGLDDAEYLWVLRQPPKTVTQHSMNSQSRLAPSGLEHSSLQTMLGPSESSLSGSLKTRKSGPSQDPNNPAVTTLHLADDGAMKAISIRTTFSSASPEGKALQSGAEVAMSQGTPCTIMATIGAQRWHISFPYPINGSRCKTRIARRSLWIESSAPPSSAMEPDGYNRNPFPIIKGSGNDLLPWGIGRVNIARHPIAAENPRLDWLAMNMGASMSDFERTLHDQGKFSSSPSLQFKQSLRTIFAGPLGIHPQYPGQKMTRFILSCNNDSDILILGNVVRHDLDTGSVFLDAFVVCLTPARLDNPMIAAALGDNMSKNPVMIKLSAEEEVLWKQILPSFVERCRYTWIHGPECEYKSAGAIPLSVKHGERSICSCGDGKDALNMPHEFGTFAEFATRAAIAPISALPYVEPMMSLGHRQQDVDVARAALDTSQGSSSRASHTRNDAVRGDVCDHCRAKKSGLKTCARCGKAKYCNHSCQKAAWKAHKKECRK